MKFEVYHFKISEYPMKFFDISLGRIEGLTLAHYELLGEVEGPNLDWVFSRCQEMISICSLTVGDVIKVVSTDTYFICPPFGKWQQIKLT
jgi:hypothetical protein